MPELSSPFRKLAAEVCATCGGSMPCALHDAALREAILRPPEREGVPWDRVERQDLHAFGASIFPIHVRGDGVYVVGVGYDEICLLDPKLPAQEQSLARFSIGVATFDVLPDGKVIAVLQDGTVFQVDLTRSGVRRIEQLPGSVSGVDEGITAFHAIADDVVLIGMRDGYLRGIEFSKPTVRERESRLGTVVGSVRAIVPRGDGTFFVAERDGDIKVLDPRQDGDDRLRRVAHSRQQIYALAPLPDGTFLIGSDGGKILLFDPAKPAESREEEIAQYGDAVEMIIATSDHSFAVGGGSGILAEYAIPEGVMAAYRKRKEGKIDAPDIPPMPDV